MKNVFLTITCFLLLLFTLSNCSFYSQTSVPDQNGEMIMVGHGGHEDTFAWLINPIKKTKEKMKISGINEKYLFGAGIINAETPDTYYITIRGEGDDVGLLECKRVKKTLYCRRISKGKVEILELD